MPAYSELSRKQKILWYWRPLLFGFFVGFLFELIHFSFEASTSYAALCVSYRRVPDMFVHCELSRLKEQIVPLALAGNMVSEGIEVAFRVALMTAFISFVLNEVSGKWSERKQTTHTHCTKDN